MGKKIELFLLLLLIAGLLMAGKNLQKYVVSDQVETEEKKVVLDAGHGGRDPGKIGAGEIQEKDVNLKIAKKLKGKLEERGIQAVLTREKDETLAPEGSANRQVEDIKKRVERIDGENALLAVSIHQNSYQDPEVRGAQVFYYQHSTEGKEAAAILQEVGTSGGNSVSGTVSGYEGLFNYYNIGAYRTTSQSAVERGLWYAGGSGKPDHI